MEDNHAFRDHASPFTWLWRIANNMLKNEYRSKSRRREEYAGLDRLDNCFVPQGLCSRLDPRDGRRDEIPTFEDLEDDSWDFERKKGYQFAYTLAEFLLRVYGRKD